MSTARVFSDERFYANRQETDWFPGVNLDFTNPHHWKPVDEAEITKLKCASTASDFALTTARLDSVTTEAVLKPSCAPHQGPPTSLATILCGMNR